MKSLDRALGMRDIEEKKPMATSSEILSWYVKLLAVQDNYMHYKRMEIQVCLPETISSLTDNVSINGIMSRELHIPLGPFGNEEGTSWDDGSHERIESIFVSYTSSYVDSIRTVYKDLSNDIFITPLRGSACSSSTIEAIHLPPETPITRIDGYYDTIGIRYLELRTNNGKIGSFGIKAGSPFMYQDPRGFTGFHGRSDSEGLTALGVYVNSSATKSLNK